jgi:hypothetical protein
VNGVLNLDWPSIALWGFLATIVLTTLTAAGTGLGYSRMSIPLLVGSMLTGNRQRANQLGFVLHLVGGWLFALLYALIFENLHRATWWLGALLGVGHSLFLLVAMMPLLPSIHPRMASEDSGPSPQRQLEPPGFMGLHYGRGTPLITVLAHLVYGAILGAFYRL